MALSSVIAILIPDKLNRMHETTLRINGGEFINLSRIEEFIPAIIVSNRVPKRTSKREFYAGSSNLVYRILN